MTLSNLIERHRGEFQPLFEPALTSANTITMVLSATGDAIPAASAADQDGAILRRIADADAIAGVGGYLERRSIYWDTALFQGDAERCIHIGVDVFMPAGTAIFVPFDSHVQSFANRQVEGDYGPLIILSHEIENCVFHTLYGHLTEASLDGLTPGRRFSQGDKLAEIGPRSVNGHWTPHLHFQLIDDMQGLTGDYPGVVRPAEVEFYRRNCPDPMPLVVS